MTAARLEHVNISVSDPDRLARLLEAITGWQRRWEGPAQSGGHTIHLGGRDDYVAIYTHASVTGDFAKGAPLNHVGLVVEDLDRAERIIRDAGLETMDHGDYEPGRRFYFFDWDGIEWEIVSYA